jgi:hypothetical protein
LNKFPVKTNFSGRVYFECGCNIALANLKKSVVRNVYRCLVHEAPVKYIHKTCLWCQTPLPFVSSYKTLNKTFCDNKCSIQHQREVNAYFEKHPPMRDFDCPNYEKCLQKACVENNLSLGCETCDELKKKGIKDALSNNY